MREDSSTFVAEAFNPKIANEAISGTVIVEHQRIRFVSERANLEIPLVRLEIQLDETNEARICLLTADQPDWIITTSDSRLLQNDFLRRQPYTRNQLQSFESKGEFSRRLKLTLIVLGGFAVLALLISALSGVVVRSLVEKIPAEWEQELGDGLIAELKKEEHFVVDAGMLAKMDRAVAPLIKSLPTNSVQYKFYLVQEQMANAFALPGGHVLVTTHLLEIADRPEEIAGVVAHEIAHVSQKHAFRKIIASAGPYLIFRVFLGNSAGVLPILGESSEFLVHQSFSQEYELEADDVGWQYLVAAHIDPRGLSSMLHKLQAEQKAVARGAPQLNAFSSHPATDKRIRRLDAKWKKLADKATFQSL